VVQIRDGAKLEQLEPPSEWMEPDMGILRLNRRPPPVLPLCVLGERWATWVEDAADSASAPVDYESGGRTFESFRARQITS